MPMPVHSSNTSVRSMQIAQMLVHHNHSLTVWDLLHDFNKGVKVWCRLVVNFLNQPP